MSKPKKKTTKNADTVRYDFQLRVPFLPKNPRPRLTRVTARPYLSVVVAQDTSEYRRTTGVIIESGPNLFRFDPLDRLILTCGGVAIRSDDGLYFVAVPDELEARR